VAADEELRRVLPVIEALAGGGARISIDTTKADVARRALAAGATIVNDVSAFRFDPAMAAVTAEAGAGCVLMHMLGEPRTMQDDPRYGDVVSDVQAFLEQRLAFAVGHGIPEEKVWVDPGIGFGKGLTHNLLLLRHLADLVATGFPVVVGTSRKSFLGRLTASADGTPAPPGDRVEASVATAAWAIDQGAAMVRVHDVRETVAAARLLASRSRP
jgi:dihydropteroate synthase